MPSFIWRYLISKCDVGLEKTLVDIFFHDTWRVTTWHVHYSLMGSLVVRLVQQIGRSGHGENVMKSCVGVWGLWKCRYLPWHDTWRRTGYQVRSWLVKVSDKSELSTQLLYPGWWVTGSGGQGDNDGEHKELLRPGAGVSPRHIRAPAALQSPQSPTFLGRRCQSQRGHEESEEYSV